jgi:MFS family permease
MIGHGQSQPHDMNTASAAAPVSMREMWLISLGHMLTHWYPATFYLLLPLIGRELDLSYTEIGFIMTAMHGVGAIMSMPGGMLVDMVGRKGTLMALSLFWIGMPYALLSMTHSYWMVLVCVSLVGIGNNLWHPAAIATLAHRYPARKGLVLSLHGMGGNIGEAVAPLVAGLLLATLAWRSVVVINIVPGIVMATLILLYLGAFTFESNRQEHAAPQGVGDYLRNFRQLFRNRALMLISTATGLRTLTQSGLLTFLPVYLAYELNYSSFAVGVCMAVLQLGGFVAAPVGGHLSDKLGRKRIIMGGMTVTGITIVGMALAAKTPLFVVFVALVGFFLYAMRPALQAWAMDATPKNMGGSTVGLQFTFSAIGSAIAPAVCGMIADAYNIYTAFYFLAGTIVFANLMMLLMPAETRHHATGAP